MFKRLFCWAYFRGNLFSEGLIIGRNFAFQNGLGLTIKTASTNSPWVYIRDCLLSEGYLRLRFGGLIFGRAFFFFFEGGGAYCRNFTVLRKYPKTTNPYSAWAYIREGLLSEGYLRLTFGGGGCLLSGGRISVLRWKGIIIGILRYLPEKLYLLGAKMNSNRTYKTRF